MQPSLQAARLRHRVDILQPNIVQDSMGGWSITDVTLLDQVWAEVLTLNGRELEKAQQIVSQVTHKVTIRWRDDILAKMLIRFQPSANAATRQYQIEAVVNPEMRHVFLELLCIERNDSAYEPSADASGLATESGSLLTTEN